MIQNKNIKLILNYFAGPLVFCILLFSIYHQIQKAGWHESIFQQVFSASDGGSLLQLTCVLLLMAVNWGLEASKWQLSMSVLSPITYLQSLKAVFAGNSLAFFTPNRIGEYFGRMLYVRKAQMVPSVPLTIICSFAQVLVTLIAGAAGVFFAQDRLRSYFNGGVNFQWWLNFLLWCVILIAIFLTILYFRLPQTIRGAVRIPFVKRWSRHTRVLEGVNATILLSILSLSVARYLVFIVQYYMLFQVFGVGIDWWQAFWAVSIVFLAIAVIPSMGFLSELGVRWQANIQLIQVYSPNIAGIFATSLAVWVVNLVVPALVGGMLIMTLRIFRK